ncbi:hypothetical protein P4V86_03645 [Brevibacillus laterosporus]|uniref:hypothetical protein n=1 Tax=Brevibacillus laterosporus TaxID=1465 RepID=UPI00036ECBED|nr:hypothetical protein [Brevibacillus laterosporus]ATO48610.1 hypothetical protein BrL25_05455 [Brevibacillus laterosporus DSM 25]MED2002452.1 hypothetical protein [Brevibacillus laterosporus]
MGVMTLDRSTSILSSTQGLLEKAIESNRFKIANLSDRLMNGKVSIDEIDAVELELRELREQGRRLNSLQVELRRLMD